MPAPGHRSAKAGYSSLRAHPSVKRSGRCIRFGSILLVMRLLSAPQPGQKQVWFVIDELASLQRLPQLHTAITENRKSKNPLVLGFQGKPSLK